MARYQVIRHVTQAITFDVANAEQAAELAQMEVFDDEWTTLDADSVEYNVQDIGPGETDDEARDEEEEALRGAW